ncbi:conserved hypothetical protein [Vibrio phage 424E50-1]|nr:conserved hypothetical protein [Vibrio phage 501E54-1]CAH9014540.1 conserved hypothetical protein [Vibrio phage 424E50-1]
MKEVTEDGHLFDLISKVEKLVRLRDALPSTQELSSEAWRMRNKLDLKIQNARVLVRDRWLQLENMDW